MKTAKHYFNNLVSQVGGFQHPSGLVLEKPPRKRRQCCGCFSCAALLSTVVLITILFVYLIAPGRSNILILGIDSRDHSSLGRSDTIIMTTWLPAQPYIGMLSIPRDLWVEIPGYGYNRINTANFFGEAENPGTGPFLAKEAIKKNFGVDMDYYILIDLIGFLNLVDALGGIMVTLPYPTSGYSEGVHQLNGEQALALVRDRANSDDFFRMERGQIVIKGLISRLVEPTSWIKLPETIGILSNSVETDIPFWRWPQLAITFLRTGSENIDSRTITREMVNPFTTDGGAAVLAPKWEEINPVLFEMFAQ